MSTPLRYRRAPPQSTLGSTQARETTPPVVPLFGQAPQHQDKHQAHHHHEQAQPRKRIDTSAHHRPHGQSAPREATNHQQPPLQPGRPASPSSAAPLSPRQLYGRTPAPQPSRSQSPSSHSTPSPTVQSPSLQSSAGDGLPYSPQDTPSRYARHVHPKRPHPATTAHPQSPPAPVPYNSSPVLSQNSSARTRHHHPAGSPPGHLVTSFGSSGSATRDGASGAARAEQPARAGSPVSQPLSPVSPISIEERLQRQHSRKDRARGRIVDHELSEAGLKANQEPIERLLAATAPSRPSPEQSPATARHIRNNPSISSAGLEKVPVQVQLPSRRVVKHIDHRITAAELAEQLVKEHRLEFAFEHNNDGDGDEIILWEWLDGTRRPLRPSEALKPVIQRWGALSSRSYFRTTSTALRNDVDSLASLVPRRDMLRNPPELLEAEVHFSRPSVIYNPHVAGVAGVAGTARSQPTARGHSSRQVDSGDDDRAEVRRVPSKLNPNDHGLVARRTDTDSDNHPLQYQLVWGFGSLDISRNRLVVKQKPGNELVCSLDLAFTDVYEWPHPGPKKYLAVLRTQQANSTAVYISTDSAKVFSVLRNAVYTARTKTLLQQRVV